MTMTRIPYFFYGVDGNFCLFHLYIDVDTLIYSFTAVKTQYEQIRSIIQHIKSGSSMVLICPL